jgi:hypothetical protein
VAIEIALDRIAILRSSETGASPKVSVGHAIVRIFCRTKRAPDSAYFSKTLLMQILVHIASLDATIAITVYRNYESLAPVIEGSKADYIRDHFRFVSFPLCCDWGAPDAAGSNQQEIPHSKTQTIHEKAASAPKGPGHDYWMICVLILIGWALSLQWQRCVSFTVWSRLCKWTMVEL